MQVYRVQGRGIAQCFPNLDLHTCSGAWEFKEKSVVGGEENKRNSVFDAGSIEIYGFKFHRKEV